jgi:hypothetical protein
VGKKSRKAAAREGSAGPAVADGINAMLGELWVKIAEGDVFAAEQKASGLLALPLLASGSAGLDKLLARALIAAAEKQPYGPEGAAFLRLLMALGPRDVKREASAALAAFTADGVYPPEWVTSIAKPEPRQAYRGRDVYGDRETVVMSFAYGDTEHTIVVVIDLAELPTVISVVLSKDADGVLKVLEEGEFVTALQPVTQAEARHRVETPLATAGQDPDSVLGELSVLALPLARSRVRRLPAPMPGTTVAYTAADRASAVAEFLRSPRAAEAGEEQVARFWAQVLTGYSGRVTDEPPARVGQSTLTAMLLHVARTFTLSAEQAGGLRAAVTAWVRWAADRQGIRPAAVDALMLHLAETLDGFQENYDDPYCEESRRYLLQYAAPDADAAWLADCRNRREFGAPMPEDRDPADAKADGCEEAGRSVLVATEFANCAPRGQETITLLTGVARVVEELWRDDPPSTWEAAKKLLTDGHDRHEVLHLLAERGGAGGVTLRSE